MSSDFPTFFYDPSPQANARDAYRAAALAGVLAARPDLLQTAHDDEHGEFVERAVRLAKRYGDALFLERGSL